MMVRPELLCLRAKMGRDVWEITHAQLHLNFSSSLYNQTHPLTSGLETGIEAASGRQADWGARRAVELCAICGVGDIKVVHRWGCTGVVVSRSQPQQYLGHSTESDVRGRKTINNIIRKRLPVPKINYP